LSNRVETLIRKPILYWVIWALCSGAQLALVLPLYGFLARLAACGLLGLALVSLWTYAKDPERPAPIVPLILLEFYVVYGVAQFFSSSMALQGEIYQPSERALTVASAIALLAAAMFLLGQRAGALFFKKRSLMPWGSYPSPERISPLAVVAYSVCTLAYASSVSLLGLVPAIAVRNILNNLLNPMLAFLLLLFLHFNNPDSIRRWVVNAMFASLLILGIASGMIEGVVAPVYVFFLSSYLWKGQTKVRWFVVVLVIFLVLNPAKYKYRTLEQWGKSGQVQSSLQDRLSNWKEALVSTWNDPFAQEDALQTSKGRTSFIVQLAQVIEWTPSAVPYNRGTGVGTALVFFIPRFIWPSKPNVTDLTANRYATSFGLTTYEGTETTTYGIYQPADGYWDWGLPGAMGYPFLYGALIASIFLGSTKGVPQTRLVGALFTVSFLQGIVSFSYIIASMASLFVFSWLALHGLRLLGQMFFQAPLEIRKPTPLRKHAEK
jgi:hypothetical protein